MELRCNGKQALVTGGAHRVGRAIALQLAAAGADIALHYGANVDGARATAAEIEALGRKVVLLQADLASWDAARDLAERAILGLGHLDILVNSASSFVGAHYLHATEQQFDASIDVNFKSPFVLGQVFGNHIIARGASGHIVNIVDEGINRPYPPYAAHGLSKAALLALTRLQAAALGPHVRVNAVCPGPVLKPPGSSDANWEKLRERNPLRALGTAEQVGECVLFLIAGPQFVNADVIMLEGGASVL